MSPRAGDFRHYASVERMVDGKFWEPLAKAWISVRSTSENESIRVYELQMRWTPKLAFLAGILDFDFSYRVRWNERGGVTRTIYLVSVSLDEKGTVFLCTGNEIVQRA